MDHNDEFQDLEFDLEDILKEFSDHPEELLSAKEAPAADIPVEEAPTVTAPAAPLEEAPVEEAPDTDEEPEEVTEAPAPATQAPVFDGTVANLEDTNPMPPIFSSGDLFAEEASFEEEPLPEAPEEETLTAELPEDLQDPIPEEDLEEEASSDSTQRFEPRHIEEDPTTQETVHRAPIPFSSPRSRLRELKKKLVSGPEKRYYVLAESGLGKLQAAILVNVLVVLLCGGVTALFLLGMVPDNRLRLVIFSQVLGMLISALMGCQLMLDSIVGLFKGRFTPETLLTITFGVCLADSVFCLDELRVPCCAAFCLSMTMALWARYHRHTTEMAQMDTMRKAVRLYGIVRREEYYQDEDGLIQVEGEVEDFMDTYDKTSAPQKFQNFYAFLSLGLCIAIAVFAGLFNGISMGVQILAASLLVAVPATTFISVSRPAAILEQRLHMVGAVLCGWQGVKGMRGKAYFPLNDTDLFPQGSTKLNGVKFYGGRNPDEVVAYCTSLIHQTEGGLVPLFQQLLASRNGEILPVESFRNYGGGGIGGIVRGEPVLLGDMSFLQDMGVEIPEGTMVNQAVYAAIDGQLCAVYAISYAKMRSAAAGLVTLSNCSKLNPIMVGSDFMVTEEFIQAKFGIKTRRILFPEPDVRRILRSTEPDPEEPVLAITTREELISSAYAVTGARALATSTKLGVTIHLVGGILGMLMMLVLAVLGNTELLTPTNILLYQLIWAVPGLLVTEWVRTV